MPGSGPVRLSIFCALAILLITGCGDGDDEVDETLAEQATSPTEATRIDDNSSTEAASDGDSSADEQGDTEPLFPDVIAATAEQGADGTWTFSATLSSPYDTPDRYADGWRVVGPDGTVYGTRPLAHDHQSEQPFTRSQSGIEIPAEVTEVTVEGRDQISGWGGATVQVVLDH